MSTSNGYHLYQHPQTTPVEDSRKEFYQLSGDFLGGVQP